MRASIATSARLVAVVVVALSSSSVDGRRQIVGSRQQQQQLRHNHHRCSSSSSSTGGLRRYHRNNDENVALQQQQQQQLLLPALIPRGGGGGGGCGASSSGEALLLAEKKKNKKKKAVAVAVGGGTTSAIAARGGDRSKSGGGGGGGGDDDETNKSGGGGGILTLLGVPSITPRAMATLSMAGCMSLHYLAYSLARPATMTLFTSSRLGFGSSKTAYPLAMTFISPLSFLLLLGYGTLLERGGPLYALRTTTMGCAGLLGASAMAISRLDSLLDDGSNPSSSSPSLTTLTKYVVGALFVFRESYVQLITSQHWSFMSSILTPNQSGSWFAPISGLTSVTSAGAALGVGWLSDRWGLHGVLGVASLALGTSALLGGTAYSIAEKNGFNPADEHNRKKQSKKTANGAANIKEESLVAKARDVFARVPTLWALFCEILACQGLSTLLNVCCVTKVSEAIPDDTERAGWMGRFFATINVLSCILQFGVLPMTSSFTEPSVLWRGMPLLMLAMTFSLAFPRLVGGGEGEGGGGGGGGVDPSLNAVASAFLLMKTLEFSVRRMLDEMVYVPLDYESRFLGKEVIGVLGYRFGKSAASLALSAITSSFGAVGLRDLAYLSTGAAGLWLGTAWRLGGLVPTRAEAEEAYEKMKRDA